MKVLLDESVPVQVADALVGHDVSVVSRLGWAGMDNGDLLEAAEAAGFHVLILADKNLRYQQNLSGRQIAIVELWTNHRPTLERHFPQIAGAVSRASTGSYIIVTRP